MIWNSRTRREFIIKISKYISFKGCKDGEDINERIKQSESEQLQYLLRMDFGNWVMFQLGLHPHPDYKEILGLSDKEYDRYVNPDKYYLQDLKELLRLQKNDKDRKKVLSSFNIERLKRKERKELFAYYNKLKSNSKKEKRHN
jgi:hypothetical protein